MQELRFQLHKKQSLLTAKNDTWTRRSLKQMFQRTFQKEKAKVTLMELFTGNWVIFI